MEAFHFHREAKRHRRVGLHDLDTRSPWLFQAVLRLDWVAGALEVHSPDRCAPRTGWAVVDSDQRAVGGGCSRVLRENRPTAWQAQGVTFCCLQRDEV